MGYVAAVVDDGALSGIMRSARAREELAKAWLIDVLERTPLGEVEDIPISWIVEQGPALISDILRGLGEPAVARDLELPAEGIERIDQLGELRPGDGAVQIPRDLAALQALLIEAMRREVPERHLGAFATSVERLAEIFGDIQSQVSARLVRERSGGAGLDPLTGLPGPAELHEWLRIMVSEQRRHGDPFALVMIDVDGLRHINDAYGREAGDRMLRAVTAVITARCAPADRAFRLADDEFCVLSAHQEHRRARSLWPRHSAASSTARRGTRARASAITAGISSCPEHGDNPEATPGVAEEAAWAAKAAGRGVGVGTP